MIISADSFVDRDRLFREAHGWPVHGSGAGILDCAGFEKARYYRRKSLWCEEPQLYLATRPWSEESAEWIPCRENWNYKAGEKVIVMCYSNLPETAVFINGKEAGRQIGYNDDGAYRFEVFWEAGILEASGYDENGNIIEQERLLTTQNAAGIKAEVYQPEEIPFQRHRKMDISIRSRSHLWIKMGRRLSGMTENCVWQ